jgi:hypothetical protein
VSSINGVKLFVTVLLVVYLDFVTLFSERLLHPNLMTGWLTLWLI